MTITEDERRFLRLLKEQSAERNVRPVEYFEAMIAALEDGKKICPGNEPELFRYTQAVLDEKYPVIKEGKTA